MQQNPVPYFKSDYIREMNDAVAVVIVWNKSFTLSLSSFTVSLLDAAKRLIEVEGVAVLFFSLTISLGRRLISFCIIVSHTHSIALQLFLC